MAETRTLEREVLEGKVVTELQEIASRLGVSGTQRLKKSDLISAIMNATDGKAAVAEAKSAAKAGDGASAPPPAAGEPAETTNGEASTESSSESSSEPSAVATSPAPSAAAESSGPSGTVAPPREERWD
ncbi:MAG: Rho termination factor N-terminal domain-containing protein, partial [Actinomycetota bacterium]